MTAAQGRRGFFIAGTDTEIGKTRAAVAVTRALARSGLAVAAMKPVAAGALDTADGRRNGDALALAAAASLPARYALVNPYCLTAPISPHLAAAEERVSIDLGVIAAAFHELARSADCVVAEGAGGWLAPVSERHTMADVALTLGLPVVLVVGLKLGCLNHALLTARAIEASGLGLAGWIGNGIDPRFERLPENLATLERLLGRPPLFVLGHEARRVAPDPARAPDGVPLDAAVELPERTREALAAVLHAA